MASYVRVSQGSVCLKDRGNTVPWLPSLLQRMARRVSHETAPSSCRIWLDVRAACLTRWAFGALQLTPAVSHGFSPSASPYLEESCVSSHIVENSARPTGAFNQE
jgi:hypothetical protein